MRRHDTGRVPKWDGETGRTAAGPPSSSSGKKRPGTATLEFLDPIPTGLDKDEFLARLEAAVEGKTAELVAEATGQSVEPAVRVLAADEIARATASPATA